jgi:hypothetical protein
LRRASSVFLALLLLAGASLSAPVSSGGGGSPSSDEGSFSETLMLIAVVGVAVLLAGDLLFPGSPNEQPSTDPDAGTIAVEDTGVDWSALTGHAAGIPKLTLAVFPGTDGRRLSLYFLDQLAAGEGVYYNISGPPVALGSMALENAASVAFSHLGSGWFLGSDTHGLNLFEKDHEGALWSWNAVPADSADVRAAAASFREFLLEQ